MMHNNNPNVTIPPHIDKKEIVFVDFEAHPVLKNMPYELSGICGNGEIKFHSYIRPLCNDFSFASHKGVYSYNLENAPSFDQIFPIIESYLKNKYVVSWNMKYDRELFPDKLKCAKKTVCAMERISPLFNYFSMDFSDYTYVKLWDVMQAWDLKLANQKFHKKHRALTDAYALYMVWERANEMQFPEFETNKNVKFISDFQSTENEFLIDLNDSRYATNHSESNDEFPF